MSRMPPGLGAELLLAINLTAALVVVVLVATIVAHELGHLLLDVLLGFDVVAITFGPLQLVRIDVGWRRTIDREKLAWGATQRAMVAACPRTPDGLRARHAAAVAAGPLAALAVAGVTAVLAAALGSLPLAAASAVSAAFTAYDLLPFGERGDGTWSDRRWLLCWLKHPERAIHRLAVGSLRVRRAQGTRPRDWGDDRWIDLAAGGREPPATADDVRGCQLAYYAALDRGQVERACELAERTHAHRHLTGRASRPLVAAELAFCLARFQADPAAATRLLSEVEAEGLARAPRDAERARAAIHLAAGRPAEALAACDRILEVPPAHRPVSTGMGAMVRELVEAMREEARRRVPAAAGTAHASPAG